MIPVRASDLEGLISEAGRQADEASGLFGGLSDAALVWRPNEQKWSMSGHLTHLTIVNAPYLASIEAAVTKSAAKGPRSDGPYRHPRITSWFARTQEPPVKRRMKTMRSMVPDPGSDPREAVRTFQEQQRRLAGLMERTRGVDLGRVRFGSPFLAVLRFSLGTGFEMLLAHNRRHLWLAREVMEREGFSG